MVCQYRAIRLNHNVRSTFPERTQRGWRRRMPKQRPLAADHLRAGRATGRPRIHIGGENRPTAMRFCIIPLGVAAVRGLVTRERCDLAGCFTRHGFL